MRYERLRRGEVRVNPELEVELQGRPDFVFEALSATSQRKALVRLVEGYARALVPEYWIADLRALRVSGLQVEGPCELRVLVLDEQGTYVAQEADDDGWTASPTWGRALLAAVRQSGRAARRRRRGAPALSPDQREGYFDETSSR